MCCIRKAEYPKYREYREYREYPKYPEYREYRKNHTALMRFVCMCVCVLLAGWLAGGSLRAQSRFLPAHPRLLFTAGEEQRVRQLIAHHEGAAGLAAYLKHTADSLVDTPQIPYELDRYGALLWTSRAYVYRLGTLSLAYRLYGDKKYLDAANRTLLWVCDYPDWHPEHYLDNAEMATAVAVAYDWLYGALPLSTRTVVKDCLYQRAVKRVLQEYATGDSNSWAKRETNWNVVCNTGMLMAALAVAEDYPEELEEVLEGSARYMPRCLHHFAPDGVCYEGPAYWGYTAGYLSLYLKAVADNDEGRGGIARLSGLDRTALYSKRTLTPSGRVFNFANAGTDPQNTPAYFFFSRFYEHPEVAAWYRNEISKVIQTDKRVNQLFFLALPWYDEAEPAQENRLPAMEVYHNTINDIIVFNGNRQKKGAVFLIAKGGEPMQAHQQLDCGTFLIESEGVCWTEDMGADDYALPGFWDYKPAGQRWHYFRNTNLAHNTLSIDGKIQYSAGEAFVCEEDQQSSTPSVKLDMTSLYKEQASAVFRTFTLTDDCTMEVEDEVKLVHPSSVVSWMATTCAEVEVNGNEAHLMQDGKHFYLTIVSPADAVFETYPAANWDKRERPISGFTMLEAKCRWADGHGKIVVRMSSRKK